MCALGNLCWMEKKKMQYPTKLYLGMFGFVWFSTFERVQKLSVRRNFTLSFFIKKKKPNKTPSTTKRERWKKKQTPHILSSFRMKKYLWRTRCIKICSQWNKTNPFFEQQWTGYLLRESIIYVWLLNISMVVYESIKDIFPTLHKIIKIT